MRLALSFDDVLIVPRFSDIESRKNCNTEVNLNGLKLALPVISSNMDTITADTMANAMLESGGIGCLHRFMSIEDNVKMFLKSPNSIVSVGITENERDRVLALKEVGAKYFMIDVAHGASLNTAKMYEWMRNTLGKDTWICVGNFATQDSYSSFNMKLSEKLQRPDALKVGIGGGSLCSTRVITGCGLPTLESILEFKYSRIPIIADGGIRNSGDIAKALAAGASAVMIGNLLAGTDETPGDIFKEGAITVKKYRGSASAESYVVQGKTSEHRSPEGVSKDVLWKGPVKPILQQLKAGLMSAMSYVGASNMSEFKENTRIVQVTTNGTIESHPHGAK